MVIFPAIDILGGKAVRLLKGDYNKVTVYSDDPCSVARTFASKDCKAIHIVDLDGAREGSAVNMDVVRVIAQIPDILSEIGGGIRNMDTVCRYLDAGISRVILGTAALEDPVFLKEAVRRFGQRIAVGVDMKDGKVAVKGWLETSSKDGLEFLRELEDMGVGAAIVTDISRDGAMRGANLELYRTIAGCCSMDITASGGVSTLDDVRALRETGVYGAIIGKAYYTGAVRLEDALEVCR
ncbi:MAG: 1-(5-phosphoribosyl)-5-[Spirochaetales bacterium]|nr:1-(5-phosphoribosyl)-5-[(5-phosphoribosylamino)methylideneamino]imidazole-4-carboxamide isomerase [Spirochaetales bacterium]